MKKTVLCMAVLVVGMFIAACSDYVLKTDARPSSVEAGGEGKLVLSMKARGEYHINPEGLVFIVFEPPEYIALEKTELRQEDRDPDGSFYAKFTVAKDAPKGPAKIKTKITFQLCTETQCLIKQEERNIGVTIK